MKLFKLIPLIAAIAAALVLAGCSSQPNVEYVNPGSVDTTSIGFGSTDLQTTAQSMVTQMLTSPRVTALTKQAVASGDQSKLPVIMLAGIQNNTNEHIDTNSIENAISTRLINSGMFNFVAASKESTIAKELKFEHGSGMVNPATAAKVGQQVGAQYMLYGDISSIEQSNQDQESLYFQITMKLLDIQSGLIVWQGEKQIRKIASRQDVGW